MKFRVTKRGHNLWQNRQRASERQMKAILLVKFGENRRNIQKIYDSVRKELQDEITVFDRS